MINTLELKKKILMSAFSGELSERLPSESSDYFYSGMLEKDIIKTKNCKKCVYLKNIPETWINVPFEYNFKLISTRNEITQAGELLNEGDFVAISQSKKDIEGYCNDSNKLIKEVPLIIFGDHTKNVKYIDFDFVPCGDGLKCIKSLKTDSKYAYYWILFISLMIENRGYARHFALIREHSMPIASQKEQKRIVEKLDSLFLKIEKIEISKNNVEEYKDIIINKILEKNILLIDKEKTIQMPLEDALDYIQPTEYIVKSTKYSKEFSTPVLTAGKTYILGYTNENFGIYKGSKDPCIIFDDFTTSSRFVNFDFKVKSSAMKILVNKNPKKYDTKYLYYLMQTIVFDATNHKRFWISKYSKINVSIPDIETQKRMVKSIDETLFKLDNLYL